jgi:hypothetical protein
MAETIICTKTEFCNFFKGLPFNIGSYYSNTFPYNCLYNHGLNSNNIPVYSADCWNMLKSAIWNDLQLPTPAGAYAYLPGKYGLYDWNGAQLLSKCTDVSSDFSSITPGEFLLTANADHAAVYVGTVTDGTYYWNVVEATPIWADGIQFTWVDSDGTRRQNQGGAISVAWAYHGKLPWVDYVEAPPPPDPPDPPTPAPDLPSKNIYTFTVDDDIKKIIITRNGAGTDERSFIVDENVNEIIIDIEDINA